MVLVTATTSFQLGYMALPVGFLVAPAMRLRPGIAAAFGCGRRPGLLGCLLGNFLTAACP
jgi:hypothetical protein